MKRYILTVILALCFCMNLGAQSGLSDGFFTYAYEEEYREGDGRFGTMPLLPGHNTTFDYDADPKQVPVGSGLLLLAGLGLGYASFRKLKAEN